MAMRIAVGQFNDLTEEKLKFAKQIGASGIQMNTPLLEGKEKWKTDDIVKLAQKVRENGLAFEAIENVPVNFYDKVMLGAEGRDEQIENYCQIIEGVGAAEIPILGYHFMPNSVWRTDWSAPGRGGAGNTQFDLSVVQRANSRAELEGFVPSVLGEKSAMPFRLGDDPVITEEEMWRNYAYFLDAVLPVAEKAGVVLALHPDDPPMPSLGGVARLFYCAENFKRAEELSKGSKAWALDLCLGCCSSMVGGAQNLRDLISYFGPKGKIAYVHFRDVQGCVPKFTECFLGEGNFDPAEVMTLLMKNDFKGFILDDHVPQMDGDTKWNHRGRAHAIGYLQGLLNAANWQPQTERTLK